MSMDINPGDTISEENELQKQRDTVQQCTISANPRSTAAADCNICSAMHPHLILSREGKKE